MSKPTDKNVKKYFEEVINRIKIALNTDKDTVVAEVLNIQPTAFYNRRKNGSLPLKNIVGWASKKQVSIDWLVTGEGFMVLTDAEINLAKKNKSASDTSNVTKVIIEHQDIIRKFKDPEKAKELNEFLIEIEENDPEGFEELYREAKAIAKTINRLKKTADKDKNDLQEKKSS
ncbi:MAG: helix-turn-helix domain containing protein [Desulfobacula sp.]|nr:helix-turn-helix domain containing protein [Desulfobacula sp.]